MRNGYELEVFTGVDADSEEQDVRRQGRVERSVRMQRFNQPKMYKGSVGRRLSAVISGQRLEKLEEELAIRERSELRSSKSESVIEDGNFQPLTFATGEEAAKLAPAMRKAKLPTARAFRLHRPPGSVRGEWIKSILCD